MSPLDLYKLDLLDAKFSYDSAQEQIIHHVNALYVSVHKNLTQGLSPWQRLFKSSPKLTGLYIYGKVGRGKTYILDLLQKSLTYPTGHRVHFHQFMQSIHQALSALKGQTNPLVRIAKKLAQQHKVLLLDEFQVSDIADAMLLSGLLKALFAEGVILVCTSNSPPDQLYKEGLQREKFLPAIAMLKAYARTVELTSDLDYRKHKKIDPQVVTSVHAHYRRLFVDNQQSSYDQRINVNKRAIRVIAHNETLVWFDFNELCATARSNGDYLFLARLYPRMVVSDIPILNEAHENTALRFIHLIDTLYDAKTIVYYNSASAPERLYQGRLFVNQFERTASRLIEMASKYRLDLHNTTESYREIVPAKAGTGI